MRNSSTCASVGVESPRGYKFLRIEAFDRLHGIEIISTPLRRSAVFPHRHERETQIVDKRGKRSHRVTKTFERRVNASESGRIATSEVYLDAVAERHRTVGESNDISRQKVSEPSASVFLKAEVAVRGITRAIHAEHSRSGLRRHGQNNITVLIETVNHIAAIPCRRCPSSEFIHIRAVHARQYMSRLPVGIAEGNHRRQHQAAQDVCGVLGRLA